MDTLNDRTFQRVMRTEKSHIYQCLCEDQEDRKQTSALQLVSPSDPNGRGFLHSISYSHQIAGYQRGPEAWIKFKTYLVSSFKRNKFDAKWHLIYLSQGFPGGSDGEESACSAGDLGSIPGLRLFPGEGHGNPLQYSCLPGKSPWTKESGGLQSMGLHRVGHD